jgi:hypothetical protein
MAVEDKPIKSKNYTANKNAVEVLGFHGWSYFDVQFVGFWVASVDGKKNSYEVLLILSEGG